jgi:hypothetical protein
VMLLSVERNVSGDYTHIYVYRVYTAVLPHAIFPWVREEDLDIYRIRCSTGVLEDRRQSVVPRSQWPYLDGHRLHE